MLTEIGNNMFRTTTKQDKLVNNMFSNKSTGERNQRQTTDTPEDERRLTTINTYERESKISTSVTNMKVKHQRTYQNET